MTRPRTWEVRDRVVGRPRREVGMDGVVRGVVVVLNEVWQR